MLSQFSLTTADQPLLDVVEVDRDPASRWRLAPAVASNLLVDVVHDGHWLPSSVLVAANGREITQQEVLPDYVRERDWGARAVATRVSEALGLESFVSINVARVLLDFARFPGSTPRDAAHLHRFAINYPFSTLLSYRQKKHVLETYYDEISKTFEQQLQTRRFKVSIHTYDQFNASGTMRPAMSVMTRTITYQARSELPAGLFDPMYPDVHAEFTADRVLQDRISLTLGKAGIPVAHDYPYMLPEGSLEVRHMVWSFFRTLREAFEQVHPETVGKSAYTMVWGMLLDTNLRSSGSDSLRSFLHMYRQAPRGREVQFEEAAKAYDRVRAFCYQDPEAVERYRFSPTRASSLAIEVRKDIVCELGEDGVPVALRWDNIELVAQTLAEAIHTYFTEDRPEHAVATEPPNPWLT